jgi:hypothetical protein
MLVQLKSIASVIDTRTRIVYAAYQQGGYDISSGVHYTKLSKDMRNTLSENDKRILKLWTRKVGIMERLLYLCKRFKRK